MVSESMETSTTVVTREKFFSVKASGETTDNVSTEQDLVDRGRT